MTVNGIEITQETILATRIHFADIHRACISDAQKGITRVNDLDKYLRTERNRIQLSLRGDYDNTLTFVQRALWIQTGVCVGILG